MTKSKNNPTFKQLQANNGKLLGISCWFQVRQDHMNLFGEATQDIDPQHMEPEWAKDSPFGQTIAYGFWTLAMLSAMAYDIGFYQRLISENSDSYPLNYGLDKVRMIEAVPVGSQIRLLLRQKDVRRSGKDGVIITTHNTIEIKDRDKPALVAEWLFMLANVS